MEVSQVIGVPAFDEILRGSEMFWSNWGPYKSDDQIRVIKTTTDYITTSKNNNNMFKMHKHPYLYGVNDHPGKYLCCWDHDVGV